MSNHDVSFETAFMLPEELPLLASELQLAYIDYNKKQAADMFTWASETFYGPHTEESQAFRGGLEITDLTARVRRLTGAIADSGRLVVARTLDSQATPNIKKHYPIVGKSVYYAVHYGSAEFRQVIGRFRGFAEDRSLILENPASHRLLHGHRATAYLVPLVTADSRPAVTLEYYEPPAKSLLPRRRR
jgi:hypothetical protein